MKHSLLYYLTKHKIIAPVIIIFSLGATIYGLIFIKNSDFSKISIGSSNNISNSLIAQNSPNASLTIIEDKNKVWQLNNEQILKISKKLAKYENINVEMIHENSPEIFIFAGKLARIFKEARWKLSGGEDLVGAYNGIKIYGYGDYGTKIPGFIIDLNNALISEGVQVNPIMSDVNLPTNTVRITVGKIKQ